MKAEIDHIIAYLHDNGFDVSQIGTKSRKVENMMTRHALRYLLHKYGFAALHIGRATGGYDHTTVLHSISTVKDWSVNNKKYWTVITNYEGINSEIKNAVDVTIHKAVKTIETGLEFRDWEEIKSAKKQLERILNVTK